MSQLNKYEKTIYRDNKFRELAIFQFIVILIIGFLPALSWLIWNEYLWDLTSGVLISFSLYFFSWVILIPTYFLFRHFLIQNQVQRNVKRILLFILIPCILGIIINLAMVLGIHEGVSIYVVFRLIKSIFFLYSILFIPPMITAPPMTARIKPQMPRFSSTIEKVSPNCAKA